MHHELREWPRKAYSEAKEKPLALAFVLIGIVLAIQQTCLISKQTHFSEKQTQLMATEARIARLSEAAAVSSLVDEKLGPARECYRQLRLLRAKLNDPNKREGESSAQLVLLLIFEALEYREDMTPLESELHIYFGTSVGPLNAALQGVLVASEEIRASRIAAMTNNVGAAVKDLHARSTKLPIAPTLYERLPTNGRIPISPDFLRRLSNVDLDSDLQYRCFTEFLRIENAVQAQIGALETLRLAALRISLGGGG